MKQEILDWLASGYNVDRGVLLLEKYSKNSFLVRMVKTAPAKNLPLIIKELAKLANVGLTSEIQTASNKLGTDAKASSAESARKNQPNFRQEFPFLNESSCPMELKALVTDKFSSYYRYRDLHSTLCDCTTPQQCADTSLDIINSYQDNRAIYAELDYYKQHKTILGHHPIFKHFNKMKNLRKLNIKDLVRKQIQLEHNIWRIESEIKKKDKPHLSHERLDRIKQKQFELAEVNRLLE